jgi:hypothetical protein
MKATCRLHRKASNDSIVSIYKNVGRQASSPCLRPLVRPAYSTRSFCHPIKTTCYLTFQDLSIFSVTMDVLPLSSMVQVISVTSNWEADYNFTRKISMRMEFSMIFFLTVLPFPVHEYIFSYISCEKWKDLINFLNLLFLLTRKLFNEEIPLTVRYFLWRLYVLKSISQCSSWDTDNRFRQNITGQKVKPTLSKC